MKRAALVPACLLALALSNLASAGSSATVGPFVAPTGNDGACERGNRSRPCQTFGRAYQLARPGDVVRVLPGKYAAQSLVRGSQAQTGPAIRFLAKPRTVTIDGDVRLGSQSSGAAANSPSFLTFDGIDINGSLLTYDNVANVPGSTNLTIRNAHIWDLSNAGGGLGYGIVSLSGVSNVMIERVEVGPSCCGADGVSLGIRRLAPRNIVLRNSTIHDIYDSCRFVPKKFGACSGRGFGDTRSGTHVDGIHMWAAQGLTIANNRFYGIGANGDDVGQSIFLSNDATDVGAAFSNVLIQNNMVWAGASTDNNTVSIYQFGRAPLTGYLRFLHNTFGAANPRSGNLTIEDGVVAPGTPVEFAGNILQDLGHSTSLSDKCQFRASNGQAIRPTYSHNLIGNRTCGPSDQRGTASFLETNELAPDLRLRPGSRGIASGDARRAPARDIHGKLRPRSFPPDLGASQREGADASLGSIGAATLGTPESSVTRFYGGGRVGSARVRGRVLRTRTYRVHRGRLVVWIGDGKVAGAQTTSRYYSFRGVGVGSARTAARRLRGARATRCGLRFQSKAARAYLRTSGGRISSISVFRRAYDRC